MSMDRIIFESYILHNTTNTISSICLHFKNVVYQVSIDAFQAENRAASDTQNHSLENLDFTRKTN